MVDMLKEVYSRIMDKKSRIIFEKRMMYSLTGDESFIVDIVDMTRDGKDFIKGCKDKNVILYGGGLWCESILRTYPNLSWKCIWDNNRIGIKGGLH